MNRRSNFELLPLEWIIIASLCFLLLKNFLGINVTADILNLITGGFLGASIALWLDKYNKPQLDIIATEDANQDYVYPPTNIIPGRWKFFRVKVVNKPVPKLIFLLFARETAEQLHAKITFVELNRTMKGRWAGTLELPFANPGDRIRLANFPDPENIFTGDDTILDVFAKYGNDIEAYGWNNEAYLHRWRTPHYRLDPGEYNVEIVIAGLNTKIKKNFLAHIDNTIDNTYIRDN